MFTAFSIVILPLCLVWFASPVRLLTLMLIASVFEAAAALVLGSFGVQPGLVPAAAFLIFVNLQMLLGAQFPSARAVLKMAQPFIAVTLWAAAGAYVLPRVFAGQAMVWPQKQQPPFTLAALGPNSANINQVIYLVVDCMLVVFTAIYLTRPRLDLSKLLLAYWASGFVAAAIAMWQFASKVAGVGFPESVFYSNPGWAILTAQSLGRVPRINGSFSEPSALAGFMASIVCATGWVILQGNADRWIKLLFGVGLITMILSTSTTGFAVLAIAASGVVAWALLIGSRPLMAGILRLVLPLAVICGVAAGAASALLPEFDKDVQEIVDSAVNKQDSASYADRTSADLDSLQATLDTGGLGVGWGSNRSSSLVPGLLAGLGVPGVVGLGWFAGLLTRRVRAARRRHPGVAQMRIIDGCCGGLVGFLLAAALSAPTISSVTFYFLLALLIACVVRLEHEGKAIFFEKKKQKTFVSAVADQHGQRFFGSLRPQD